MRSRSCASRSKGERKVTRSGTGPSVASGCASSRPRSSRTPMARKRFSSISRSAFGHGDRLGLGVPPLGEVPDALLALPADDRDLAARREALEHEAHLPRAPPAMALAAVAGRVLDLAREEGAALAELLQDVAPEGGVLLEPGDDPQVERAVAAAHPRLEERQVLDRVDERVPLDELPLLPEQPVELRGVERSRACSRGRGAAAARRPRSDRAGGNRAAGRWRARRARFRRAPARGSRSAAPPRP